MATLQASIFKKYDIRGLAQGDNPALTPEVAHPLGRAFGTWLQQMGNINTCVVGRDNRHTSASLQDALMNGLQASGVHVVDIGLVATPLVYWHAVKLGSVGGVMVTASHLGPQHNGFKLCIGNRTIYGDSLQSLQAIIHRGAFFHGRGERKVEIGAYGQYTRDIAERIPMARALRVAVDAGNGTAGLFIPRLLQLWGHEIIPLYLEPDGDFPNHPANPQDEANLQALAQKVREAGADVGLAFDGDADRVGVVDEQGNMLVADRVLALLSRDMLKRHHGAVVVADVLSSQVLFDVVEAVGGKPIMAPSGHSLVKDVMRQHSALLGGEMSGHIFLAENYYGYDDAFFAAGRLLQLLSASRQPLSALDAELPRLYSTPEYRPHCPDEDKERVIAGVAQALSDKGEVVAVDGVRIKFERGWGLLRASNTEPVLSLRFEGETEADALSYRDIFAEALRAYPQVEPIV